MKELSRPIDPGFLERVASVLTNARKNAKTAVNLSMVYAYYEIGRQIVEEELIREDGKFYPMMKVIHGEEENILPDTPYTLEEWFGGLLLERKHPVLKEYLDRELRIRDEILEKLKNAPNAQKRAGEVEEERQAIIAALKEYESI